VLLKLIFFDIFYTERWIPQMMRVIGLDYAHVLNDEGLNIYFERNGYYSM